jgi:hypothetical protein
VFGYAHQNLLPFFTSAGLASSFFSLTGSLTVTHFPFFYAPGAGGGAKTAFFSAYFGFSISGSFFKATSRFSCTLTSTLMCWIA